MSTDERHLLIMVERLPDEIAQVYSRTKQKKSLQHRNSFKHRKLKDKAKDGGCGESDGTVLSPAARETGKLTTVTPSHLPMSLPMYSRSISLSSTHEEKTEAGNQSLKVKVKVEPRVKVKIKPNKRGRSLDSNKVLRKIKIRKISKDASSPNAPENDTNSDTKVVFGKDIEEGSSKGPSEKYEIVLSSGRVTDLHEESVAASEESIDAEQNTITKGNVEAWLKDHVDQPSEGMKGDTGSISEESTVKETETSDDSSVNQDTESYNTDHEDFAESDGSQRTEIDAASCTSSDTEIDEADQCQLKVASSIDVETVPLMSNEGSCHSDMLQECSTALEHIVSEVCAEKQVSMVEDSGNSGNDCVDIKADTVLCNSASAETEDVSVQPNEAAEQVTVEVLDDDLCDDEQKETASNIDFIDITEDALVLSPQVEGPNPPTKTVMPPDSSTGEPNNGKTSCSVDVVDLTNDDVDCYVVSPVNEHDVAATSGMTGVCMAAAKELDLFANMTILESWDIEAESILACTGEYLGHLEKCLTSLDLMEEAFKTMLVTALREKGQVFKQIFAITQRQVHHGQPMHKQGSDPNVSTLLKELQQIANGSFTAPSTNADAREKVVTVEAKQAQPLRQATATSTSVAASSLLSVSSVTSASLSRQISLLPVATTGCSTKVTALPVNVTVLPAATSASAPMLSATTTSTSVVGGTKSVPQASAARASPHSILQKLQRNTGLTVMPVQQREKLAKEDTAADGSSLQKNIPVEVTAASSETASVSRDSVIAVPSGLSITSTPARVSTADKTATRTSEQVAVIQLGKGSQRHLPLSAAKPTALAVSTTSGGRINLTVSQQPTNAPVVRAVIQRTVNMGSTAARSVPSQQQRTVGYSRHVLDARSTQISSTHPSPVVSRSVTTDASSRTVAAPLKSTTVMTTSHRLLLPRLPAGALQPVSTVSGQSVPRQPPVQATTSVAPVLVQATTLQNVRWSQQQQSQQLCVAVPGFRVVQAPSFQGRAVAAAPPPLQWCGPPMAVGRPIATNILRQPATIPPFPWGGFVPQDPRFVGRAPLSGPQAHPPGQAMPTQQPILPRPPPPPYYR
ncbi:hypothetical protein HPB49_018533 [Dermacentor silvarum]|uniref:Uncharacterized protein n=1 Tax=Dermacentor silvarum TaxID=543639 RepID=A0ACB8D7Q4_DERSI|nr:hypothetical protein HPB49_018533 [Dermacentor silvarum]